MLRANPIRWFGLVAALWIAPGFSGCGDDAPESTMDASLLDAGAADGAQADGSPTEAGALMDASPDDGGTIDGGGAPPPDASVPDAIAADSGEGDAGGDCTDDAINGAESDVDCGGGCDPCDDGSMCRISTDCASAICILRTCRAVSCTDGVRNGTESDVDCGGSCLGCLGGERCGASGDCAGGVSCAAGRCVDCADGALGDNETDVDCGGPDCATCAAGLLCDAGSDCASGTCTAGRCSPHCGDGMRNGTESDVDCGGSCAGCNMGDRCTTGLDCADRVCLGTTCRAPSCGDGVRNGGESDVDCGGTTACPRCDDFSRCDDGTDCSSSACTAGFCGSETCATFGTDAFGYIGCSYSPTALPCPDIRSTGTATMIADDGEAGVPIGFDFVFYGITRDTTTVGANGALFFGLADVPSLNLCLPDGTGNAIIAAFWDNLDPGEPGSEVFYETRTSGPRRQFVVQWDTERWAASAGDRLGFTIVLEEGTNVVQVCYADTSAGNSRYDGGASATVGIQSGSDAVELSCDSAALSDGLVLRYSPP